MTPLEILRSARELISDKKRWTKGVRARDASGNAVDETSPNCVCWCAAGAVWHAYGGKNPWRTRDAFVALDDAVAGDIVRFNDTHTHAEVLNAFDKAIAKLEAA